MLEAKAIWEHTCIAGGLLVFFVSFFGSTKNETKKTGPCPNKETPNPSRVRGRGVEVSETLFLYMQIMQLLAFVYKREKPKLYLRNVDNLLQFY